MAARVIMINRRCVIVLIMLGLLVIAPLSTRSDHLPWMDGTRNAAGESCCGDADCIPRDISLLAPPGDVVVNGQFLRLPPGSVHPAPWDQMTGWWCWNGQYPRCGPPFLEISQQCARCVFFLTKPGEG